MNVMGGTYLLGRFDEAEEKRGGGFVCTCCARPCKYNTYKQPLDPRFLCRAFPVHETSIYIIMMHM